MSQSGLLLIFLIVIAVLVIIVIVLGVIGITRRNKMGRTLNSSTEEKNVRVNSMGDQPSEIHEQSGAGYDERTRT